MSGLISPDERLVKSGSEIREEVIMKFNKDFEIQLRKIRGKFKNYLVESSIYVFMQDCFRTNEQNQPIIKDMRTLGKLLFNFTTYLLSIKGKSKDLAYKYICDEIKEVQKERIQEEAKRLFNSNEEEERKAATMHTMDKIEEEEKEKKKEDWVWAKREPKPDKEKKK
jgi:hypothetical protein